MKTIRFAPARGTREDFKTNKMTEKQTTPMCECEKYVCKKGGFTDTGTTEKETGREVQRVPATVANCVRAQLIPKTGRKQRPDEEQWEG